MATKLTTEQKVVDNAIKRINRRLEQYGTKFGTNSRIYKQLVKNVNALINPLDKGNGLKNYKMEKNGIMQIRRTKDMLNAIPVFKDSKTKELVAPRLQKIEDKIPTYSDFYKQNVKQAVTRRNKASKELEAEASGIGELGSIFKFEPVTEKEIFEEVKADQNDPTKDSDKIQQALEYIYNYAEIDDDSVQFIENHRGEHRKWNKTELTKLLKYYESLKSENPVLQGDYRHNVKFQERFPNLKTFLESAYGSNIIDTDEPSDPIILD